MKGEMKETNQSKKQWALPGLRHLAVVGLTMLVSCGVAMAQEGEKRVRIGGDLQQAKLVRDVRPIYPVLARRGRIEGVVRIQAIIGKDGSVDKVEPISGHPVLQQAAMDAVRQWRYKPTTLNGEAVEVVTTIDVVFKMS